MHKNDENGIKKMKSLIKCEINQKSGDYLQESRFWNENFQTWVANPPTFEFAGTMNCPEEGLGVWLASVVPMPRILPPPFTFEIVVEEEKLLLLLLPLDADMYGGGAGVNAGFAVLFAAMMSGECCCLKYGLQYAAEYLGSIFNNDWSKFEGKEKLDDLRIKVLDV